MKWPWLPPDTDETRGEPGDPSAALRVISPRISGLLRLEAGGPHRAFLITDAEGDRWLSIDWDGTITTGRTSDEPH